jgi:hypothetical protein
VTGPSAPRRAWANVGLAPFVRSLHLNWQQ